MIKGVEDVKKDKKARSKRSISSKKSDTENRPAKGNVKKHAHKKSNGAYQIDLVNDDLDILTLDEEENAASLKKQKREKPKREKRNNISHSKGSSKHKRGQKETEHFDHSSMKDDNSQIKEIQTNNSTEYPKAQTHLSGIFDSMTLSNRSKIEASYLDFIKALLELSTGEDEDDDLAPYISRDERTSSFSETNENDSSVISTGNREHDEVVAVTTDSVTDIIPEKEEDRVDDWTLEIL